MALLRRDLLPMLPKQWLLVRYEKTRAQFEIVRKILDSPRFRAWLCATGRRPRGRVDLPLHL